MRTALRFVARERRRNEPIAAAEPSSGDATPHAERPGETLPRDVREYLTLVPEAQRTAIVLHHALGYSLDEVAELTGVSRNTVKGRLRLGTAALRKMVRRELRIGAMRGGHR